MATEIISKTVKITRPATDVYAVLSDFTRLIPQAPAEMQHEFQASATTDECTIHMKNATMGLRIINREEPKFVKYESTGKMPFAFLLWAQLKEAAPYDTRMRLVLHANLNAFMKVLLKKKLETGIDEVADRLAQAMSGGIQ